MLQNVKWKTFCSISSGNNRYCSDKVSVFYHLQDDENRCKVEAVPGCWITSSTGRGYFSRIICPSSPPPEMWFYCCSWLKSLALLTNPPETTFSVNYTWTESTCGVSEILQLLPEPRGWRNMKALHVCTWGWNSSSHWQFQVKNPLKKKGIESCLVVISNFTWCFVFVHQSIKDNKEIKAIKKSKLAFFLE